MVFTLKKYLIIIFTLLFTGMYAQDIDPLIVLDSAQNKVQNIKSYTVDAIIDIDVDFLRMPSKEAKITYEYPNKLNIETKGFSMIPKYGLRPFMKTIAKEDNMAIYAGMEQIEGNTCYIIKLLPRADGKIIMIKLWIRVDDYLVARSETFTRRSGSFLIDFNYDNIVLPSSLVFSFEARGINIPWKFMGNSIEIDKTKMKENEIKVGKVYINFSNYEIEYSE